MKEKARATPVATCTMKETSVAVPKTYHHFASCGAMCFIGLSSTLIPMRSSSQRQTPVKRRLIGGRNWDDDGIDLHFAIFDANRVAKERSRRRTGGYISILVVNAAVAGTEEQLRAFHPTHRAT